MKLISKSSNRIIYAVTFMDKELLQKLTHRLLINVTKIFNSKTVLISVNANFLKSNVSICISTEKHFCFLETQANGKEI